jgi:uncharacterized membrane protein YedE/YeeE
MTLPIQGSLSLILAVVFGAVFGALLHRGRVADYNVIVNQFRFRDFTVLRVMLSAIVVGGIGVYVLHQYGLAQYHIKPADMLAVISGAALFGVGMVLYGYCPGTGIAAVGTGSIHALVGFLGMLVGGILYALSFPWIKENVSSVASLGKIRLPDVSGMPDLFWLGALLVVALVLFRFLDRTARSTS